MVKMFRVYGGNHITEVAASRYTQKSVWLIDRNGKERRVSVSSDYCKYFLSRDDAVDFAYKNMQEELRIAQANLDRCKHRLEAFKKLEGR